MDEPLTRVIHENLDNDWSSLGKRETIQRHLEQSKDNEANRLKREREHKFELWRDGIVTCFLLLLLLPVLYYTGGLITQPGIPAEAKQLAVATWTAILSGGTGYLFGKRSQRVQ